MENTKITLKNKEGIEYILEYNRLSVQQMERMGFSLEDVTRKPMTMFPLMFRGAFLANCRFVKEKEITEIYDNIKNREKLHNTLMTMISECYETLTDSDEGTDTKGNVDWEIV
jgi:uncharacterized protein YfkK (UPF0435 family)